MGFRGQEFAFESPAAAVAGMLARLGTGLAAGPREPLALSHAMGRILAEPVACDRDSPAFDYAAMDGYAVRAADLAVQSDLTANDPQRTLAVVGEAPIGCAPPVLPGIPQCADSTPPAIRIVTGAAIPAGADAVIKREDVGEHADGQHVTAILIAPHVAARVRSGDHIRKRGENARAGDTVLDAGTVLTAAAVGTLAAVGCAQPRVHPRLRVALITTGDELVAPDEIPADFQIRNSNAATIAAVLGAQAWIEVVFGGFGSSTHVGDDQHTLDAVLCEAISHADAVVLTGGVSMGHRDPVRAAVETCGADVVFHGLPQRPGKPILGAIAPHANSAGVPIIGLPGNPISAMVTCIRIVMPLLAALAGASQRPTGAGAGRARISGTPLLVPLANPDGKSLNVWWHRLVRIDAAGQAELIDGRGSGDIIAGGCSDGFVEVPPTSSGRPDNLVPFYPWPI